MHSSLPVKNRLRYYTLQYGALFFFCWVMALATVLRVESNMGGSPWDVFHTSLMNYLPMTLGQVSILVSTILLLVSMLFGIFPYIGTILDLLFVGIFTDCVYHLDLIPLDPASLPMRVLYLVLGLVLGAAGIAGYMATGLKYGPRDGFMMAMVKSTGLRVGIIRVIMEVTVTVVGVILGGKVGIGTIVSCFMLGFLIEYFMKLIGKFKATPRYQHFLKNNSPKLNPVTAEKAENT